MCLLGVTHAQRLRPLSLYSLVFSVYMRVCATTPGDGNKGNKHNNELFYLDCTLSCFTLLVLPIILQKLSGCSDYSGFFANYLANRTDSTTTTRLCPAPSVIGADPYCASFLF